MSRFVTVDAATYFSTPDTNREDGNTAHIQQAIGKWFANSGSTVAATPQAPPVAPPFGTLALKVTGTAAAVIIQAGTNAAPLATADPATEYTHSVYVYTSAAGIVGKVRPYDVKAGSYGANTVGTGTALTQNAWTQVYATRTTAADADAYTIIVYVADASGASGDNEVFYVSTACSQEGADPTFSPSLRIVANDTYTKSPADLTAAFTSGVSLTVGVAWAGDAVRMELSDGVGGPAVAVLSPTDIASVGDTDTWVDLETGRTWTVNGAGAVLVSTGGINLAGPGQLLQTGG